MYNIYIKIVTVLQLVPLFTIMHICYFVTIPMNTYIYINLIWLSYDNEQNVGNQCWHILALLVVSNVNELTRQRKPVTYELRNYKLSWF